jgi:hypothetical protein
MPSRNRNGKSGLTLNQRAFEKKIPCGKIKIL